MKLIERYIAGRVLAFTIGALAVVTGIVLTTQLLTHVDMVTRSASAAASFGLMSIYFIPSIAQLVLPFALLLGVMRTMTAMNGDSELAVLEAAGRSPGATARPVIMLAAAASLFSLFVAHTVEPLSNRGLKDTLTAASADLIRAAVQSGSFTRLREGTYVQIGDELPNGEFGQVAIVDTTDATTQIIYYAKRGSLLETGQTKLFVLADGEIHRRNKESGQVSIISFATSAIDFSQILGGNQITSYGIEARPTTFLMHPDPADELAASNPDDIRREFHRRFSDWLYPLAFGLIAVFFAGSARSGRQAQAGQVALGAFLALAVRALGFFVISSAGVSHLFAFLSYALPGGIIAVLLPVVAGGVTAQATKPLAAVGSVLGASFGALFRRRRRPAAPGRSAP